MLVTVFAQQPIPLAKQQPKEISCLPAQGFQFWQSLRLMPVKITSIEDNTAYWEFNDTHGIELGSFHLEKDSLFVDTDDKKRDRLYFEYNAQKTRWAVIYETKCFSVLKATQIS
jgi:hypothetical protein